MFGLVNFGKLCEGLVEMDVVGMLLEVEIVFFDEVFFGLIVIFNILLGLLNEC